MLHRMHQLQSNAFPPQDRHERVGLVNLEDGRAAAYDTKSSDTTRCSSHELTLEGGREDTVGDHAGGEEDKETVSILHDELPARASESEELDAASRSRWTSETALTP